MYGARRHIYRKSHVAARKMSCMEDGRELTHVALVFVLQEKAWLGGARRLIAKYQRARNQRLLCIAGGIIKIKIVKLT